MSVITIPTASRKRAWRTVDHDMDHDMDRALSLPIHHGKYADHMGFICEQLDALRSSVA